MHESTSRRSQTQASRLSLSVQLHSNTLNSPSNDTWPQDKVFLLGKLTPALVLNFLIEGKSHRQAVLTGLTLATQSPAPGEIKQIQHGPGLEASKNRYAISHQVAHSKGLEVTSEEVDKGQSWTNFISCRVWANHACWAKHLLHTQVFPFWSNFHLISGLCCISLCCFTPDLLDLGFALRIPHQNHWIMYDSWGPVCDNFLFRDIVLIGIGIHLFIHSVTIDWTHQMYQEL